MFAYSNEASEYSGMVRNIGRKNEILLSVVV